MCPYFVNANARLRDFYFENRINHNSVNDTAFKITLSVIDAMAVAFSGVCVFFGVSI